MVSTWPQKTRSSGASPLPPHDGNGWGEQLCSLVALAKSMGQLARVFLWGSFVTSKEAPNDLDVLLVMSTEFAVEALPAQA